MNPFAWLDDSVCRGLMLTLAHFLWQGLAVGILAAMFGLLLRRRSSQSRYLLFTSALLVMAASPVATYVLLSTDSPPPDAVAETEQMPSPYDLPEQAPVDYRELVEIFPPGDITAIESEFSETAAVPVPVRIETVTETAELTKSDEATINWPGVLRWLTYLYLAGVMLLLGRFLLGIHGADRLRRSSRLPDDSALLSMISLRAGDVGLRKAPVVLICEQLLVPAVVGILRPAVLMPAAMITCLTPQELQDVLTHELAHVRRCDNLVNFLQRVVESFLFIHPAVWFVSRRIRIEREHCCDDLVLALGTAPVDYAGTLLSVVENCAGNSDRKPIAQLATLAAVGSRTELRRRIERIVNQRQQPKLNLTRKGIIMTSMTASLLLAGSLLYSATFQSSEDKQPNQSVTQTEATTVPSSGIDDSILPEAASGNGTLPAELDDNSGDSTLNAENDTPKESRPPVNLSEEPESADLVVAAILQNKGREEAWLLRRKDKKRFAVGKGDLLKIGKSRVVISDIGKSDIKISSGKTMFRVELGKPFSEATAIVDGNPLEQPGNIFAPIDPTESKPIATSRTSSTSLLSFGLRYQSASEIADVLKDVMKKANASSSHQITVDRKSNSLIVHGSASDIKMVEAIIILLDRKEQPLASTQNTGTSRQPAGNTAPAGAAAAKSPEFKNYSFEYYSLDENTNELANILSELFKDHIQSGSFRYAFDSRTNSLLVTASSKSTLEQVENLIKELDRPVPPEQAKQIRQQSANNPFLKTMQGTTRQSSVTTTPGSRWQPSSRQETASGRPADLIQLSEAYANAYRDVQLAEVEYKNASVLVKSNTVSAAEVEKAKVKIDAARLKLDLLKQIAEGALQESEEELADLKKELDAIAASGDAVRKRQQRTVERRLSQQKNRIEILQKLISR